VDRGLAAYDIVVFLGLLVIAYLLNKSITVESMAAGSGIPQVKGIILGFMKMNWLKVVIAKFIGARSLLQHYCYSLIYGRLFLGGSKSNDNG
jgi:H+/Cl- antiporter ClcA